MEITFHSRTVFPTDGDRMLYSWQATERAINNREMNINTTQMGLLDARLWEFGYRIFVVDEYGKYEIKIGADNERTSREIRSVHNLFQMWKNGEFDL